MKFVKTYWTALEDLFPETFENETYRKHMLLKALGLYSLNWLAKDVFNIYLERGYDFGDIETLKKLLKSLKSFDWSTQTSPLSSLGGMKGVDKAHDMLLGIFNKKSSLLEDKQATLQNF